VTELRLYDVVHSIGVATDLNHIDTPAAVSGYLPADNGLEKALTGAELVICPAGELAFLNLEVNRLQMAHYDS
jgi:malate dehydrogenase